jgi:hypothetical protein
MKFRNTNSVTGNATVGSQHDVATGDYVAERKAKASKKDRTDSDDSTDTVQTGPHNVASGDDRVSRQVGIDLSNGRG